MRRRILDKIIPKRPARIRFVGADADTTTTETQSPALHSARATLLRAAEITTSGNAISELLIAGRVALEVFNCVKEVKVRKSEWEELVIYIAQLFEPIMYMLERQSADDTDRHLKQDLGHFREDMERILVIVKAPTRGEMDIARCKEIVNNSLRIFHMYTTIALRMEVSNLSERISGMSLLHTTSQAIDNRYSTTYNVGRDQHVIVNHVHSTVQDTSQIPSELSAPPPQPVPPEIFYGRDKVVDRVVEALESSEHVRIAILGTGGIGKTSLALHLMNRDKIVALFDHRRHFVACDAITSADTLAILLLSVLGTLPVSGESPATTLQRVLNTISPTLLVLDNFETPWDPEASRSAIEDLLATIGSGKSHSVVITMRGTVPPSVVTWTHTEIIVPLSPEAARQTFYAINPSGNDVDGSEQATLDVLLKELDWVPLAIRLLAVIGRGFTPAYLLRQWEDEKTALLHIRNHRLDSIAVSISLSLSQLSITDNPEAIQLLGVLSLLPDGLSSWIERVSRIGRGFTRVHHLARVLLQTSLCFLHGETLKVLSPIRHYIVTQCPAATAHVRDLEGHYWDLIRDHAMTGIGPKFPKARKVLDPEIGNIRSLIRNANNDHPSLAVIEATIDISWYFARTIPSIELLMEIKEYTQSLGITSTEARRLQVLGENLHRQARYAEASECLKEAQDKFTAIGNALGAARCSLRLGDVLYVRSRYKQATAVLTWARATFVENGDVFSAAQCSRGLGNILYLQSRTDEASDVLQEARSKFIEIGNALDAAQCSQSLGDILNMQSQYDEAIDVLQEARAKFIEFGSILGALQCSKSLGNIIFTQRRYDEAAVVLKETREQFIEIGDVLGATQCLRSLGQIRSHQGQYVEASKMMSETREQFLKIGSWLGAAQSLQFLGDNLLFEGKYAEAKELLMKARDEFSDIGHSLGIKQCEDSLAKVAAAFAVK